MSNLNSKKYDKVMLNTAILWSKESYCIRGKVGAVISKDNRIISTGYNGAVSGKPNICEEPCEHCKSVDDDCKVCNNKRVVTNKFTIHAEANAILDAAKNGTPLNGTTIYITKSPCVECSKMIVQSGIKRVVYIDNYKDTSGIDFLKDCNINVLQYECRE